MSDEKAHIVSNLEMATVMMDFPAHLPWSDRYEQWESAEYEELGKENDAWWESQREFCISWFYSRACDGGYPGYATEEGRLDAVKTYNYLQCPAALIWIAEAFGVDKETVRYAAAKALTQIANPAARCGAIRAVIPWETIAPLARKLVDDKKIKVKPSRAVLKEFDAIRDGRHQ